MAPDGGNVGLAALSVAVLLGILGLFAFFALRTKTAAEEEEKQKQQAPRRRGALDRMQRGARAAGEAEEADEGKKTNALKEQKKQEKRANQQAQQQAEREAQQVKAEKNAKYSQKQQEREAERLRKEAEQEQARKEKEQQEQEEFSKWKEMFAVEAEGEDDGSIGESAVEKFIDYVKLRKVVNLEDLAAEFRMRTVAAINRLEELEKMGRLSGIFDDRGKYIYITVEEMASVAEWLKRKGRVNRADLVAGCNKLIRLNPTEEDKEKLDAEARTADLGGEAEGETSRE
ncbi:unnamed protein product [Effrenium voratum]|uniref:DDRGK domain-containing protein 1 n=1 Tax=Effrenium voratum TaxID=2562239 RepID=A0AA36J1L8_9DINO|nr:unnamed protein product [Effrenium voratum]